MRRIAIIPARGGSKRLVRKNIVLLAGKPLLSYAIESALKSNIFDKVCVSSEDDKILEIARTYTGILCLKRPPELATDTASVREVCAYLLEDFDSQGEPYDEFAILLVTNPLRLSEDICAACEILKHPGINAVTSLVPFTHPPQRSVKIVDGLVKPFLDLSYMTQTQNLEQLYRHDGSVYFAKVDIFLKERVQYGSGLAPYFIPPERSVDIDSMLDLEWAEFLLLRNRDTLYGK